MLFVWLFKPAHAITVAPPDWPERDIRLNSVTERQGLMDVVVAVIDTGSDIHHPKLTTSLWRNPGEIPGNKIDDDHNGFVDDVHGWDFVSSTGRLSDKHGHGTHIAGIIKTAGPAVKLMTLKYYDSRLTPGETIENTIKAIRYAIQMGAQIINYSAGGSSFSQAEFNILKEAGEKGVLVVAAAGNEGTDSSVVPYFPANYPLANILSVTAHNPARMILPSSNYGIMTVDLSAPGENIYSSLPQGKFGLMTGTSQATAYVTAIAALAKARFPNLVDPVEVKRHLIATAVSESRQRNKTQSDARLDALQAIRIAPADKNPIRIGHRTTDRTPS